MKDYVGACLSGVCLLHCLLVPVLLALGGAGLVGAWLQADWVHYLLIAPIALLVIWSLPLARRKHHNGYPLLFGVIGLSALLLSLFVTESTEPYVASVGSLSLIFAHLLNIYLLKTSTAMQSVACKPS